MESKVVAFCRVKGGVKSPSSLILTPTTVKPTGATDSFQFTHVFPPTSEQEDVFERCVKPLLSDIKEGFNGTLFAYGQTGSGKTYTMTDMIHRSAQHLFAYTSNTPGVRVEFSLLEIYLDEVYDLTASQVGVALKVREFVESGNKKSYTYVQNLQWFNLIDLAFFKATFDSANKRRKVSATAQNDESTRSIVICSFKLTHGTRVGTLDLVDLCGSERAKKTLATGQTLTEAKAINLSLSQLGNVVNAVITKQPHIPYRNSTLTFYLSRSIGGNSKTHFIIAVRPEPESAEETYNTLLFSQRVQKISNHVKVNEVLTVEKLQQLLEAARTRIKTLEDDNYLLDQELQMLKATSKLYSQSSATSSRSTSPLPSSSTNAQSSSTNEDTSPQSSTSDPPRLSEDSLPSVASDPPRLPEHSFSSVASAPPRLPTHPLPSVASAPPRLPETNGTHETRGRPSQAEGNGDERKEPGQMRRSGAEKKKMKDPGQTRDDEEEEEEGDDAKSVSSQIRWPAAKNDLRAVAKEYRLKEELKVQPGYINFVQLLELYQSLLMSHDELLRRYKRGRKVKR